MDARVQARAGFGATGRRWFSGPDGRPRVRRYLLAALGGGVAIWGAVAAAWLFVPRTYTVESSLIVPNGDPDARVDLKDTGQAYATARSNYDAKSLDPRVNYKEIMLSANVIDAAASAARLTPRAYGQPRIKLIDQSSVMEIRTQAGTPALALRKATALHQVFQARLNELRQDELAQREQAVEQAIRTTRDKLSAAQQDLVRFKVDAQVVSERQLDEMALVSTQLQRRQIDLGQQRARDRATVASLSAQLGMPARLVGWTLTLQGDAVFLAHFEQFASASAQLTDHAYKWAADHPKVREASGRRDSAQAAMAARAGVVLGVTVAGADLQRMAMVLQDRSRDQLLRDLVGARAAADAAGAEMAEIERQRARLARELPALASQSAQLDELQRRVNFSEAVFTGAAGKPDVGHSNVFASYPMVQTLVAPGCRRLPARRGCLTWPPARRGGVAAAVDRPVPGLAEAQAVSGGAADLRPESPEEQVLWHCIVWTYAYYLLGALYVLAPVVGWTCCCGRRAGRAWPRCRPPPGAGSAAWG